ncbi:hypothetical protein QMK19_40720 [Streptomyces sp. H10-C2]|uniref:hypothetical protein n=1 Tax=unclassified Streptomyces TaxID=2593676 RepID=UPI0024B983E1|nr:MULTISPECIES: hypothetical protein [unclassified Streptomyces]MDJ0347481.1 hypothetical protein [Streptomyces sp. PH10-H1]MDJ0375728.1 hypothetical protein [Streptomyces sp. H10-C2]
MREQLQVMEHEEGGQVEEASAVLRKLRATASGRGGPAAHAHLPRAAGRGRGVSQAKRKPADALREARRRDSVAKRGKVLAAIDAMKDSGTAISFAAVARTAEVSAWLVYAEGVREHVEAAMRGQAKGVRRERKSGVGALAASMATDLKLARAESRPCGRNGTASSRPSSAVWAPNWTAAAPGS